jgi:hypothetical protein
MATLLLSIRKSVATRNVVLDMVKLSIRRTTSRSRTLLKRSNLCKLTFSSCLGFYLLKQHSECEPDGKDSKNGNNDNNNNNSSGDEISNLIKKLTPMASKLGIIIINHLYYQQLYHFIIINRFWWCDGIFCWCCCKKIW